MELENSSERRRQRSARRLRHEAEVKVFREQGGSLENIRRNLGLRPSQICEILKVHPSAWTRWVRNNNAPPHVYQMLEWYVELLQWRGQHSPMKESPYTARMVRTEDPKSYVPTEDPSKTQVFERSSPPADYRKRMRILTILWCIQSVLWCMVLIFFLKHGV